MNDGIAERILAAAAARFDAAELYEESGESVSVSFDDNRLKEIITRQTHGVGLRVIHRGRIGFAATSDLRDADRLLDMAEASAAYGDEARFELPPHPVDLPDVETYDEAVLGVGAEQMTAMGREALAMSREANDDYLYGCGLTRSAGACRILNTAGLAVAYSSTSMSGHVGVQLVSDDGLLQVYEYKSWSRPFESVTDLARTVLRKMAAARTIVPARLEAMPMVFTPKALGNLFGPLGIALNGKHVHKGSSVLAGRIGEQVLDPRLTITDDPTVPFAPGTCPVDDEGLPARRQHLFQAGVLRTYMTDLQTAALLGVEPSGHASRSYSSRPAPSPTNVIVGEGDASYDEMVAGMERGLIIEQTLGAGQSNVLAGEFSVNVELGFLVEDGQVRGRVKDCMVAGNVYEVLARVEAIGSEPAWLGSRCAPPLMVGGLKLAAQG